MSFAINIIDKETLGKEKNSFRIRLISETMTVEELIFERVSAEVEKFNNKEKFFIGLVKPSGAEVRLNGPRKSKAFKKLDPEEQARAAIELFKQNGYFLFVDKNQFKNIDDIVTLKENSTVEFIQLIVLTGG